LLSLVLGSPASGLDCWRVPSEWKTNMWYRNGASGIFTNHVPTIAGESPLPRETGRQAARLRHRAAKPRVLRDLCISTEDSRSSGIRAAPPLVRLFASDACVKEMQTNCRTLGVKRLGPYTAIRTRQFGTFSPCLPSTLDLLKPLFSANRAQREHSRCRKPWNKRPVFCC